MILVRDLTLPPFDVGEALRYAGVRGAGSADELALLTRVYNELAGGLCAKVVYTVLPVATVDGGVRLGPIECPSRELATRLFGCENAVLFVATVGREPDRLIRKYSAISPSSALFASAVGSERVEGLCDAFCEAFVKENLTRGGTITERFSPGYGDLPLEMQTNVFKILSPSVRIGVSLGEGMIMSPSKSVSAIFGIRTEVKVNEA